MSQTASYFRRQFASQDANLRGLGCEPFIGPGRNRMRAAFFGPQACAALLLVCLTLLSAARHCAAQERTELAANASAANSNESNSNESSSGESSSGDASLIPAGAGSIQWDRKILSPNEFIGFEMGERLWQHHQVLAYMHYLAEQSPRARWEPYATSHQGRELGYLTIASRANWRQIDEIKLAHRQLTQPELSSQVELERLPAIVCLGYGVHGDEPSATHVALHVAHLLVAGRGEWVDRVLRELVVRVDPCLNPDGFERFSSWSNSYLGAQANPEPWHREHRQGWPGGRVNAYWFDLNRDWLPAVHPESQGRLREYHQWRPVLVLDYHEMGTSSTYFFQPGVPKRTNPFAPASTLELTRRLAQYHARALEQIGTRYFTEERFDDFYPGKGSTYPDLKGSIGILFEQSSARGVVQQGDYGTRSLRSTVRNQFVTTCSSLTGAVELRGELLGHVRESYLDARQLAQASQIAGYALGSGSDPGRVIALAQLLNRHEISSRYLREATLVTADSGEEIELAAGTLIVDARQAESRLLRAIFDRSMQFEENAFYDVSAWALPLAYDLPQVILADLPAEERLTNQTPEVLSGVDEGEAIGWILPWNQAGASAELIRVMQQGFAVQVASEGFRATTLSGEHVFAPGTIAVFPEWNEDGTQFDHDRLRQVLAQSQVRWHGLSSGLTEEGIDWGSGSWLPLPTPRIAMVIGEGVDRYAAGAVWHRLDQRLKARVTLIDGSDLAAACREDWTVVILSGGTPARWSTAEKEALEAWMNRGGTLVALGDATPWCAAQGWLTTLARESVPFERRPFAQAADDRALESIAGAIVQGRFDLTHPLAWGLERETVPLFRDHKTFLAPSANPYATPGIYDLDPVIAGYVSAANRESLTRAASAVVVAKGRGRLIAIADQPTYRGFFDGSSRLFDNAVLLGPVMANP